MTRLLDAGADPIFTTTNGRSPLYVASQFGLTDVVQLLTEKGANVNQAAHSGATPLYVACMQGHTAVVKKLIVAGGHINRPVGLNHQTRPIRLIVVACFSGQDKVVSALLAYGAIATPYLDMCPIEVAIDSGHPSCAELIRSWPAIQNQNTAKLCLDKLKKQGYYNVVRRTADNDLPKYLFVFRVVELMKMCGMESLAEHLIGFVGTTPDCACAQCAQGGGGI